MLLIQLILCYISWTRSFYFRCPFLKASSLKCSISQQNPLSANTNESLLSYTNHIFSGIIFTENCPSSQDIFCTQCLAEDMHFLREQCSDGKWENSAKLKYIKGQGKHWVTTVWNSASAWGPVLKIICCKLSYQVSSTWINTRNKTELFFLIFYHLGFRGTCWIVNSYWIEMRLVLIL